MAQENILTDEEVRACLSLDEDGELSTIVKFFNEQATSFVDARTDHHWEEDDVIDGEAKSCAMLKLQMLYFQDAEHDFSQAVSDYCVELRLKAKGIIKDEKV